MLLLISSARLLFSHSDSTILLPYHALPSIYTRPNGIHLVNFAFELRHRDCLSYSTTTKLEMFDKVNVQFSFNFADDPSSLDTLLTPYMA